jgi:hypothetical protein
LVGWLTADDAEGGGTKQSLKGAVRQTLTLLVVESLKLVQYEQPSLWVQERSMAALPTLPARRRVVERSTTTVKL